MHAQTASLQQLVEPIADASEGTKDEDRERWEEILAVILHFDEKYKPIKPRELPFDLRMDSDVVSEKLSIWRNGGKLGSSQFEEESTFKQLKSYSEWQRDVTAVEAENAGRLLGLIQATEACGRLHKRHPQSRKIEQTFVRLIELTVTHYRAKSWPDTHLGKRQWVIPHTRRYDVMPREWRGLPREKSQI